MKNIVKMLFIAFVSLLLVASCKNEIEIPINEKYHTITFNTNGGTKIESTKVERGSILKEESFIPEKDGHIFKEWRTEEGLVYDFSTPVISDITLHAYYYVEADEEIEKKMYSLYLLANSLSQYFDDEDEKNTVLNMFSPEYLLEIAGALYGTNDGFFSDIYITEEGRTEKYYLYSEDRETIYEKDTYILSDLEGLNFELKDYDNTSIDQTFLIEIKNLGFKAEFTELEKTINVKFDATLKLTFDSEINSIERYDLNLVSGGETYSPFSFEYKEDGFEAIYGDYYYSHTHSFSEWIESSPATESQNGEEYRFCLCGAIEERIVPMLKGRNIQVSGALEKTYDGKPIDILSAVTFKGEGIPTFEYKLLGENDDKYSPISPKDVGEYIIRITIEANDEYKIKSQLEINYTINKARIYAGVISNLFIKDGREYNGEKQEWEATLGNTEDESCAFVYDNIVLGEKIIVRYISDSADAGNYYAIYNLETAICNVQILGEGETLPSNYDFSINSQAMISKKPLEGNIKIEKIYDRSYNFETTDLSSLSGVVEKDKGRLKLSVLGSYNEVGDERPQVVKDYNLLLDDEVANNYSISKSQIKLEIKPKELTLLDIGDTIITPYIEGVNERTFVLRPSNGILSWEIPSSSSGPTYAYDSVILTITSNEALNVGSVIESNNFEITVDNKNYTIKKENAPKRLEVVEVTEPIENYTDYFDIEPGKYVCCYIGPTDKSIVVSAMYENNRNVINNITLYYVSNGRHSYSSGNGSVTISSFQKSRYVFIYSDLGLSNIKLLIT